MNHSLKRTHAFKRMLFLKRQRDEMHVMLQVFDACMETHTLPAKDSPCHKILKRILWP